MSEKCYNVLFLCTGNSARSVMAEALLNTRGKGRFCAYSAGSQPNGTVNPFALEQIKALEYPVETLRSKSWSEFERPDAPQMDFVITVCDKAAGEVCPIWPGKPISGHWSFEDPAAVQGTDAEKRRAFENVFRDVEARVRFFVNLPIAVVGSRIMGERLAQARAPRLRVGWACDGGGAVLARHRGTHGRVAFLCAPPDRLT